MNIRNTFLFKPFAGKELITKTIIAATVVFIVCSLLQIQYLYTHVSKLLGKEIAEYQDWEYEEASVVQKQVERHLERMHHELSFLARLPKLRAAEGMDKELRDYLATIGASLFDGRVVLSVSFVPVAFDPDAQQADGKRALSVIYSNNDVRKPDAQGQTYRFRLMLDQLAWFRDNVPTLKAFNAHMTSGHFLFNLYENVGQEVSATAERRTLLFSVPAYNAQGNLQGMMSADIPATWLRGMLPREDYALTQASSGGLVLPEHLPDYMKSSLYFIGQAMPDSRLTYSKVLPLVLDGYSSDWKLWTGADDKAFVNSFASQLSLYRDRISLMTLVLMLSSLLSIGTLYRNHIVIRKTLRTERDEAVAKHIEKSNLLKGVIDQTVDGLITIDDSGLVEIYNPACERLFGYMSEEVVGRNIKMLMPEPHQSKHDGYIADYKQTKQAKVIGKTRTVEGRRKDGTTFPLELAVEVINLGSKRIFCGILRDITERVEAERKILSYAAQIQDKSVDMAIAKEHAEEASRIKTEFVASVSHEIRSNMSGIIGINNLLLKCNLKPSEMEYVRTVKQLAESLLQIINDVLDLSRIESGRIELDCLPFDLKILCEEIFGVVGFKANQKHLELLLRYNNDVPFLVKGDPGRLRQILLNLLNNAIKYTEKGHVLLSVWCKPAESGKRWFHVEVEDTGTGIPADRINHVFDRFNRIDISGQRKFSGGLGLSICQELCRIMGGNIGVKSELGTGSTFWFEIPLEADKGDTELLPAPQEALLEGLRVLLVDDSEIMRNTVTDQLAPYGVTVQGASSGEQALHLLAGGEKFDVAIVDLMLPGMDGVMFARALREKKFTGDITLLMVTASPDRGDMQQMTELGFVGYLSKPVTDGQLRDALSIIADARKAGKPVPVITRHNMAESREERRRKTHSELQFEKARILLVEDNQVSQTLMINLLRKYGCQAVVAGNGDEALHQLSQSDFDVVFMDCQMPVMDGFETTMFIRKLEEHQARRKLPIVALTADTADGIDQKCFAAGMNDYITKPVRQSEIESMLVKWIPKQKRVFTLPEDEDKTGVMDMKVFTAFHDLVDKDSGSILTRYIDMSREQMESIRNAFDRSDYTALHHAARTLESSSRQIGAAKLSGIASDLKTLSQFPDVEKKKLKTMIEQLLPAQVETERFIERKMQA